MIGYYVRLALKSFRCNPGLTFVMIGAIALGIAVCVVTITVYHAMSGNPIWWKNDRLYAVTMNLGDPNVPPDPRHPDMPPAQLSYETLFGGANSVGRTIRWNDHLFRVIGVLDDWFPIPKFYDLTNSAFDRPEDVYMPFGWTSVLERRETAGSLDCWGPIHFHSFRDFLNSDCVWLQMWVELPSASSKARFQALIDAYWQAQHRAGRFLRPERDRLMRIAEQHFSSSNPDRAVYAVRSLEYFKSEVYRQDRNMRIFLVSVTLLVVAVSCLGIFTLATFNVATRTKQIGTRRAVGARRADIVRYFLVENALITTAGVLVGCALALAIGYELSVRYQLPRLDLYYLVGGVLALWPIGQLSAWIPARRAANVPPSVATRTV